MNAEFHIQGKIIETDRLILRPYTLDDLDDLYAYASVEGVGEMAGWPHHTTKDKSLEVLQNYIREDRTFAICFKETNRVIGSLGIKDYGMEDKLTEFIPYRGQELGFVLSKAHWGQGLMPEAVKAVIDYLFNEPDLDFLTCDYYDYNVQSRRVQEKCGFKPCRKLDLTTHFGTNESGVMNLLLNPRKKITLIFSHPETLIYKEE